PAGAPEPGHPAVREHGEPNVRGPLPRLNLEVVPGVAGHRAARHQRRPSSLGQLGRGWVALRPARLDRHLRRVVAGEPGRVAQRPADHPAAAKAYDRGVALPITGWLTAPARLPAVHDLALVAE